MSEKRAPEPDRMDRLMELQSRLRELTEEKKAKWERLGQPLSGVASASRPAASATRVSPNQGAGPPRPPASSSAAGAAPAANPLVAERPVAAPADALTPAAGGGARDTSVAEALSSHGDPGPDDDVTRYSRRRGASSEGAREARELWERARAGGRMTVAFARRSVERIRGLSRTVGARETKPKARRGDPITAEDLIDDRSLSARLLGAAVFFIGLVAIGAVALIQLGKLEVPWLEEGALPAATGTTDAAPGASGASGSAGAGPGSSSTASPSARDDGPEATEPTIAAGGGEGGPSEAARGAVTAPTGGDSATAPGGSADSRRSREFDRLRGELAFRLGEYEIVTAEFERGEAGCDKLTSQYRSVDDAHLLVSRVVARWREVPWSQVKAYDELSESVDRVFSHYSASGCGLDESQLPPDH